MDNQITILKARSQLIPLKEISVLFGVSAKIILSIESKFMHKMERSTSKRGVDFDLDPDMVSLYHNLKIKKKKGLI